MTGQKTAEKEIINRSDSSRGEGLEWADTDAFMCGKCRQRKTRYYQAPKGSNEPMTVRHVCLSTLSKAILI